MAKVNQRPWKLPGQRTKRKAWGFTAQINGKQVRSYKAEWTHDDAEKALAAALLQTERPKTKGVGITFGEAVERYVQGQARKKSVTNVARHLKALTAHFGGETPLTEITGARISAWKDERLAAVCPSTKRGYSAAAINRPLAALRHLLRRAHEEWEVLPAVPKIRLEKEPEGRIRWLEPDEETRLLAACQKSRNAELPRLVVMALETGLRRGELLGLTWDRVDLSRGVIRLEVTKSGRRREVPMRQVVYDLLAATPGPRDGRLFRTRSIRTAFENAVAAAKVDNFHLHDCRHHFASWFVMRRGSLQALKEILGHADLTMTLRYAHLAPEHLRNEMANTEMRQSVDTQLTEVSAQASTQEVVGSGVMSSK